MAAATPVVASALDGYRNVVTDGLDAVLVEPGDPVSLAAGLRRVLCDRRLADSLIDNGTRRADQFAMSRLADEYVAIYQGLLDSSSRRNLAGGHAGPPVVHR